MNRQIFWLFIFANQKASKIAIHFIFCCILHSQQSIEVFKNYQNGALTFFQTTKSAEKQKTDLSSKHCTFLMMHEN